MQAYIPFLDIYIKIAGDTNKITSITFSNEREQDDFSSDSEVAECLKQINEYLAGKRKEFDVKLDVNATEFTSKVYNALQKIPYGTIKTYKDIAIEAGNPNASRAVGNVNNKNKFAIVIPCHRVIGSSHKMVGYAPGIKYKEYLLDLERKED